MAGFFLAAFVALPCFASLLLAVMLVWNHLAEVCMVAITALLVPFVILTLRARYFLRIVRLLGRDIRFGTILRFHDSSDAKHPEGFEIRTPDGFVEISDLELLQHSQYVWKINGRRMIQDLMRLPLSLEKVADLPEASKTAAAWAEMIGDNDEPVAGQRLLSDSEKSELLRYSRRLLGFWQVVGAAFFNIYPLAIFVVHGYKISGLNPLFIVFVVAAAWIDYMFFRMLQLRANLFKDIQHGRVLVTRARNVLKDADPDALAEVLPYSGRPWSIQGQPALWRTV